MTNRDVAAFFEEIGNLLEIKGEEAFRVNSYRRVARSVDDLAEEIESIAARGELAKIPGVGKGSAEKIDELLRTGTIALREELAQEVPLTLLELLAIPGMGPKKAALLWRERGIDSLAQLKSAIHADKLAGLKGFAAKTIDKIREGIEFLERSAGRTRLGTAYEVAAAICERVRGLPGVTRAEIAGSLRRGAETIGDIDILCVARDGPGVVQAFTALPGVSRVLAAGDTKGSVLVALTKGREIQVDLRVVPAESFGAAWQYFTGSKQHNVRLRELAGKRGWTLNEYALADERTGVAIASQEEADVYAALGVPWIPPELREDRGEFALQETPQDLLELTHIRGDLHMHTTASDGRHTIAEMIAGAKARGYEFICITDHSRSSVIANGLTAERLRQHILEVRAAAKEAAGITVWIGAEVDIHADGTLDYDDDLLAELDWVVASNHVHLGKDIELNTKRALAAIHNPFVNVLAHPTGRLINRRDAAPLDVDAIARAAAATGTALEINASTHRLDLKDQHARLARERGAKISINCDAHSIEQFDQMRFGVLTARRAGLTPADVVNAWPADLIRKFVADKRAAANLRK